ncbi:NUDIX domain-containing protein [Pelagibacterium lacus]|uniref:GDP-mannose pyrophosphatase n=1 Tax=Pelagibacterium lacus TaxID=2282655 RepID=A0A369W4Y3_9HYPH|nr:NUDIX domain-containing protein [Pelagibacterium lacus]RDE09618.1 NUDIX domain-containing protein [Pelagibacterium lacus]
MARPEATLTGKKILARDWGTLSRYELTVPHSGGGAQALVREVYDHGSAAAVLLLDCRCRVMTLVRQFRLPAQLNGDAGWMLEVCAGLLDGDDPETSAHKEALEETGIAPHRLDFAFALYASPGSLTEKVSCFLGFYGAADRQGPGGGIGHEGEDIEIVAVGFDDALDLIASGAIIDAKTVALIQHAALRGHLG